jgi:peptidoglycan/xylan/chitin deacetylase (PgdA/CDA1 family)
MLLIVNYHYIRKNYEASFPGIFPVSPEEFKEQIDALGELFEFISPGDLIEKVNNDEVMTKAHCLITFDDGLREQIEIAEPILKERGIQALYSVNGESINEHKLQPVHKIHWLRSNIEPNEFKREIMHVLKNNQNLKDLAINDISMPDDKYIYDDQNTRELKHILNHLLSFSDQVEVIDKVYNKYRSNEVDHAKSLYMTNDMIEEYSKKDQIGSHGYWHFPPTRSTSKHLFKFLNKNQEWLENISGKKTPFICYPYGGRDAVSKKVASIAKEAHHSVGITMERAVNLTLEDPLLLARIDVNDSPKGKKPLMNGSKGNLKFDPAMSYGRTWFLHENLSKEAA